MRLTKSHIDARDQKLLRKVAHWRERHGINKKKRRIRRILISFGLLFVSSGIVYGLMYNSAFNLQASNRPAIQLSETRSQPPGKKRPMVVKPENPETETQRCALPSSLCRQDVSTRDTFSQAPPAHKKAAAEETVDIQLPLPQLATTSSTATLTTTRAVQNSPKLSNIKSNLNGYTPDIPQEITNDDIYIAGLVACDAVLNRQARAIKTVFSIEQNCTPYIWMDVRSKKLPYTLKHVYYYNQKKYCEVPLKISYKRMRTWSYVALNAKDHVGNWRVDVCRENGDALKSIDYKVTP